MIKTNTNSKKGFTIIEVVLVLAIAGLIFLMVFLALPAMQASQRDTQRRNDLSRFASQITQYSANNRGKIPATDTKSWQKFMVNYLVLDKEISTSGEGGISIDALQKSADNGTNSFVDPDGTAYDIGDVVSLEKEGEGAHGGDEALDFNHKIYVYIYATCQDENAVKSSGARKVAFRYKLEGAGTYCGNN